MSLSLALNCFLLGDDPDRIFTVEIPKNENVSILKDLIREKNPSSLGNVDVKNIDLWQVSFPIDDHLKTKLLNINLAGYLKLSPFTKSLNTFFTDVADDCLHVIANAPGTSRQSSLSEPLLTLLKVQTAAVLDPTQFLSLNCFLRGDDPDRMFTVKISKTKNVSILKDLIKKEKAPHLDHVAASDLDLWKADFPINDLPTFSTDGPELRPLALLLEVFPSEPDIRFIHVIVYVPVRSECYMDSWYNSVHYSVIRGGR